MAKKLLKKGDELCRSRPMPMSSQLIEEVKNIYKQYHLGKTNFSYPPLIYASFCGLEHMVWGFIECAKQTNTNLHTGETGELQKFLWLHEPHVGRTALDMAIEDDYVGIAKLLLANASLECLLSERNFEGKPLVSMLHGSEHDEFILSTLEEAAKKVEVDPQTSTLISIDDQQQESKVYIECKMDAHSYPMLHQNEARKSLEKLDDGKLELTPNNNTILHLVSRLGDVEYMKDILKKHPSLIYKHNSKGETPTYVAAMEGHVDILEIMFNHLKRKDDIELLLMRMTDKQTALHFAVRNHHIGVVFWLMKKTPQHANHVNDFEESPLYLAVERGYAAILKLMSGMCNERAFKGPNGLTTLHAAVISGSLECIEHLLSVKPHLLYDQDKNGWTPLHFAVFHNDFLATRQLLDADSNIGYQTITVDGVNSTCAIHVAASKGYCKIMYLLMSRCPGSTEITDSKGRNILHVAIDNNQIEAIKFIFGQESLTSILNEKDDNGDTPIHLLMASDLEMSELVLDYRIDVNVLNNQKLSPLDMASSDEKRKALLKGITMDRNEHPKTRLSSSNSEDNKQVLKMASTVVEKILIVVTLIATATFAAAFTVPGGFQSNEGSKQGTPFLLRKPAFIAFVVSNTIAFSCSCSVLFGHMVLTAKHVLIDEPDKEQVEYVGTRAAVMYVLTAFAMLTMAIAFVTGSYVVLMPSLGLAIFSCLMSLFIIGVTLMFPTKTMDLLAHLAALIFVAHQQCFASK